VRLSGRLIITADELEQEGSRVRMIAQNCALGSKKERRLSAEQRTSEPPEQEVGMGQKATFVNETEN